MTQTRRPRGLPSKIILQAHVVSKRESRIVNLEEIGDEILLAVDLRCDLFENVTKRLRRTKKINNILAW